jgi:hypothetical protein
MGYNTKFIQDIGHFDSKLETHMKHQAGVASIDKASVYIPISLSNAPSGKKTNGGSRSGSRYSRPSFTYE